MKTRVYGLGCSQEQYFCCSSNLSPSLQFQFAWVVYYNDIPRGFAKNRVQPKLQSSKSNTPIYIQRIRTGTRWIWFLCYKEGDSWRSNMADKRISTLRQNRLGTHQKKLWNRTVDPLAKSEYIRESHCRSMTLWWWDLSAPDAQCRIGLRQRSKQQQGEVPAASSSDCRRRFGEGFHRSCRRRLEGRGRSQAVPSLPSLPWGLRPNSLLW